MFFFHRCSSLFCFLAFEFLRLQRRMFLPAIDLDMPLHLTVVTCSSLFLLAFVVLIFRTILSFELGFLINFRQSGLIFIVSILFAFLFSTFDSPLFPHLIHNVFRSARNLFALLAHLRYRDHSPIFLSTEADKLRDFLSVTNWNSIFDLARCNFFQQLSWVLLVRQLEFGQC